jgi:hypothetical protein
MLEMIVADLRRAGAPGHTLGPAILNLAVVRAVDGHRDEALSLVQEAIPMRADLGTSTAKELELASLRDDPRFSAIVRATELA